MSDPGRWARAMSPAAAVVARDGAPPPPRVVSPAGGGVGDRWHPGWERDEGADGDEFDLGEHRVSPSGGVERLSTHDQRER